MTMRCQASDPVSSTGVAGRRACRRASLRSATALQCVLVAAAVLGWGALPAAQWSTDYANGRAALDDGRYREAIQLLERARAVRPEPSRSPSDEYYPNYYLGLAYAAAEDAQKALDAFEASSRENELRFAPQLEGAREAETVKLQVLVSLENPGGDLPPSEPTLAETLREEVGALAAQGNIGRAAAKLGVLTQLGLESVGGADEVVRVAAERKARGAAVLQLRGRYDEAIADLEDALPAISRRPAAHLYLGWAYYARYLAEGETDGTLVGRATEAIGEALRLDPGVEADRRFVSPRLVDLLDRVRAGQE